MRHETRGVKLIHIRLFAGALLALSLAIWWFTMALSATGQPDDTYLPVVVPGVVTPDPTVEPQHWQLLNDEDTAYLLTNPNCSLITEEYGGGARKFRLECDPIRPGVGE